MTICARLCPACQEYDLDADDIEKIGKPAIVDELRRLAAAHAGTSLATVLSARADEIEGAER